jgi:hypothetical protein
VYQGSEKVSECRESALISIIAKAVDFASRLVTKASWRWITGKSAPEATIRLTVPIKRPVMAV